MRNHRIFATVVGLLAAAAPAIAQSYPAESIILQPEVEVRSGPSKNFYATSKLQRSDKVIVIRDCKESTGWLEIKPPPGSFSWINGKYVKQVDAHYGVVNVDPSSPAPVLPGSTLVNQAPNREIIKLTAGTIVIIVNPPLTINNETWIPIQPHPSEVRYIPAEAVSAATQVTTTTTGTPNWTLTPNGFAANPVLADAERALAAGDVNRARQLFQQVAATATDQNQKVYAMNRANSLQQVQGTAVSAQRPSGPTTVNSSPGNLITIKAPAWTTYGRMRDTLMKREDGQPIYLLEDPQGRPLAYVTTNPGKSLESYINRTVTVYGPTVYRSDSPSRLQYVVASHVAIP